MVRSGARPMHDAARSAISARVVRAARRCTVAETAAAHYSTRDFPWRPDGATDREGDPSRTWSTGADKCEPMSELTSFRGATTAAVSYQGTSTTVPLR